MAVRFSRWGLIALLLLLATPAFAVTKEVSTSGTDSAGCGTSPLCRTPWFCMNDLPAGGGGTCRVHVGTYQTTSGTVISVSGIGGSPNVLTSYGDGTVIIEEDSPAAHVTLKIEADYIKLTGITWYGSVRLSNDHAPIENGFEATQNFFKCPGRGDSATSNYASIWSDRLDPLHRTGLWIHDNMFLIDSTCTSRFAVYPNPGPQGLSWMHHYATDNGVIEHNDFRVNAAVTGPTFTRLSQGIGLKECNQFAHVRFNYMESLGGENDEAIWSLDNSIGDTTCTNNQGKNEAYQNILVAKGGAGKINNGLVHRSDGSVAGQGLNTDDFFYNNTVIGADACISNSDEGLTNLRAQDFNNICYNSISKQVSWTGHSISNATYFDRNLYYPSGSNKFTNVSTAYTTYVAWKTAVDPLDQSSTVTDPLFVNASAGDYHLGAGSPAATGGRGGAYSLVRGAYITGTETIGCSFDVACYSGSGAPPPDLTPPTGVGNLSPANGATGVAVSPTLVATTASDVTPPIYYYFELFTGGVCTGSPAQTRSYDVSTTWAPATLAASTQYAWHNKAKDSVSTPNESAYGACTTFTTGAILDSTKRPIIDMQPAQQYEGVQGGLYPDGTNVPPAADDAYGKALAASIVPINGKIVLIDMGLSNSHQVWCGKTSYAGLPCNAWTFMGQAAASPAVNHNTLVIMHGSLAGQETECWDEPTCASNCVTLCATNPTTNNYSRVLTNWLTPAGLTESQVQVVQMLEMTGPVCAPECVGSSDPDCDPACVAGPVTPSMPSSTSDEQHLISQYGDILRAMKARWVNTKMAVISPRATGTFGTGTDGNANPEPYAYEVGFAAKATKAAQLAQCPTSACTGPIDPIAGDLNYATGVAPWITWGAYLWAGVCPTVNQYDDPGDPLCYLKSDFQPSGQHPSTAGETKEGSKLLAWYLASPYSAPWFASSGAFCGNGVRDPGEVCDGSDLGDVSDCTDISDQFDCGVPTCKGDCSGYITTACQGCGDGAINCSEQCDTDQFGGATCSSLGYGGGGSLGCFSNCTYDTSACISNAVCGDGVVSPPEECDGANLNGQSCTSQGYAAGTLSCNSATAGPLGCTFNFSQCLAAQKSDCVCGTKPKRASDATITDARFNTVVCRANWPDVQPTGPTDYQEGPFTGCIQASFDHGKRVILETDAVPADTGTGKTALPTWVTTGGCSTVSNASTNTFMVYWDPECNSAVKQLVDATVAHWKNDPRIYGYFATGYAGVLEISLAGQESHFLCTEFLAAGLNGDCNTNGCTATSGCPDRYTIASGNPYGINALDVLNYWSVQADANGHKKIAYGERPNTAGTLSAELSTGAVRIHPNIGAVNNGFRKCDQWDALVTGRFASYQALGNCVGTDSVAPGGFDKCATTCPTSGLDGCGGTCTPGLPPTSCTAGKTCSGEIASAIACMDNLLDRRKRWVIFAPKTWNQNSDAADTCAADCGASNGSVGVTIRGGRYN